MNDARSTAIQVPGAAGGGAVWSVSCAQAGNCTAGGQYTGNSGDAQAFVVSETTSQSMAWKSWCPMGQAQRHITTSSHLPGVVPVGGWPGDLAATAPFTLVRHRQRRRLTIFLQLWQGRVSP